MAAARAAWRPGPSEGVMDCSVQLSLPLMLLRRQDDQPAGRLPSIPLQTIALLMLQEGGLGLEGIPQPMRRGTHMHTGTQSHAPTLRSNSNLLYRSFYFLFYNF